MPTNQQAVSSGKTFWFKIRSKYRMFRVFLNFVEFFPIRCKRKDKTVPVHAKKAYRWTRGITPLILNFGTVRRWVVKCNHEKNIPVCFWIRGWSGPWAGMDVLVKRKFCFSWLHSNFGFSKPAANSLYRLCYSGWNTEVVPSDRPRPPPFTSPTVT